MATDYAERHQKTSAGSSRAMGGAASGMGLEALTGDTEMVTVFDDFNGCVLSEEFDDTAVWEQSGWEITEDAGVASVGEAISMNDVAVATNEFNSCIQIFGGTADNSGVNVKLDNVTGDVSGATTGQTTNYTFPHLVIPETASIPLGGNLAGAAGDAGEVLDGTTWTFASRVGFRASWDATAGDGDWEGAFFIGWSPADDTSLLTHDAGVVTGGANMCFGFHVCILGEIYGVSKRLDADAVSEAVGNYTTIHPAGAVDNTVANNVAVAYNTCWWDLALRMEITDMDDDDANGTTTFYTRRVIPGEQLRPWAQHETVLTNETPNPAVACVPTIELITGATATEDCGVLIDWWAMGRNRVNR